MTIKPEFKIIADHLRSSSFLIADGVMPSNEGRGYVLRRIMRRAMRQLHKLGAKEVSMYKMVDALIKEMGTAYPELSRAYEVIVETLRNEEEKFRETLEKGLKILEEEIPQTKGKIFSGKTAFKLYDTYGFPLDLTQDILKEKKLEVNLEEFNLEMEEQRNRARKNWAGSGEESEDKLFFDLKEKFGETKFLGYEKLETKAKILEILDNPKIVILDQTTFYATSGGQKGDEGIIKNKNGTIKILETKKFAKNLFVHFIDEINGEFKVGDEVEAIVNAQSRKAKAQNHSATHLMHKALKLVLGNSISQKGSNVDSKYFTFDFSLNRGMSAEEIIKVEDLVNLWIQENNQNNTNLMPLEKARETGAEALFGEKYDAEVRVVKMGESVELCGGTHVSATGEIGVFKIISEKGIAAGIRRIEAVSGIEAIEFYRKNNKENQDLLEKNLQELKKKDKEIERLKKQILFSDLDKIKAEEINKIKFVTQNFNCDAKDLREIIMELKAKSQFNNSTVFALFGTLEDKVAICVAITNDLTQTLDSTKIIAPAVEAIGGKGGGGKKDLAMGGGVDKNGIAKAVELIKKAIAA
jgi:alanyl-tRNA synthetase